MGTHGYLNTHGYPYSEYPRGYGAGTGIIFIQRGGDMYHIICTHGHPLTSLAFVVDHVKRFIYVEAKTQNDINQVERLSAICLMQKFVHLKELDTKLQLISAFVVDHVKGFIYVEAESQNDINQVALVIGFSLVYR